MDLWILWKKFDPWFQPLTGGGEHFHSSISPLQQKQIIMMFWKAGSALPEDAEALEQFKQAAAFQPCKTNPKKMGDKLGLTEYHLFEKLMQLMINSVDYTIFFRELSHTRCDRYLSIEKKALR